VADPTDYSDKDLLEQAEDERAFDLAFTELLGTLGDAVTQAAKLLRDNDDGSRPWTRDEAVLVGLMVRLAKLLTAYADQFERRRLEVCNYLGRGLFETSTDLRYLVRLGTPELFQRFVAHSFTNDLKLRGEIESNIEKRAGVVLPIEDRMLTSMQMRFDQAGVTIDEIPESPRATWGGSMRDKLRKLGMEEMYQAAFAGPSSAFTHGGWHELVTYHLSQSTDGDGYYAATAFSDVRPQPAQLVCVLVTEAAAEYLARQLPEAQQRNDVLDQLVAMHDAASQMGQLHEDLLGRTGGPELAA
jgi:Family of unknown function (DUF5677)